MLVEHYFPYFDISVNDLHIKRSGSWFTGLMCLLFQSLGSADSSLGLEYILFNALNYMRLSFFNLKVNNHSINMLKYRGVDLRRYLKTTSNITGHV